MNSAILTSAELQLLKVNTVKATLLPITASTEAKKKFRGKLNHTDGFTEAANKAINANVYENRYDELVTES